MSPPGLLRHLLPVDFINTLTTYCLLLSVSLVTHLQRMEQQKEQSHCPINLKLKYMHFSNAPVTLSTTNAFSLTHFLLNIYTTLK